MLKERVLCTSLLFLSAVAMADEPNVEFYAKDNQAKIFIEKCHLWRGAMRDDNKELMWSFVEEKYKGTLKPKMANKMGKVAENYREALASAGNYVGEKVALSKKAPANYSEVILKWSNGDKKHFRDSCIFERLPNTSKWVLDI
ncbi:hypothetical protein EXT46_13060 [Pseudoalteromonas sp. CO325X]|uniref:hypothetical protein n=1 Tax=Pseudoalteromonas sp. CO325X TaxID=1777262 RepID=UPI001022CBBD|nr:hypothetical protein [Pseudoalteromonas sp. CO325X]RZF80223.1 hypothetical protein EXT46_13060 [Pseudoalteromonas sp. CO325X]